MIRCPCFSFAMPKSVLLILPEAGSKIRFRALEVCGNDVSGWFRKLYAETRNCSFFTSPKLKFLNNERSLLKNAGPKISGPTIGPLPPGVVGSEKQLPFTNWLCPKFLVGSQVRMGSSGTESVPLIVRDETLKVVPGSLNPLAFKLKCAPLLSLFAERLIPLWT